MGKGKIRVRLESWVVGLKDSGLSVNSNFSAVITGCPDDNEFKKEVIEVLHKMGEAQMKVLLENQVKNE